MSAVRIYALLIALLICPNFAIAWQANTPEAALEEMVTAETLDTLAKHLPLNVQEAIGKLAAKDKEQIAKKLLVRNLAESEGITVQKTDDGSAWQVTDSKHEDKGFIKLKNSFVSGTEAIVVLEASEASEAKNSEGNSESGGGRTTEKRHIRMLVSMRLQEGEWRLIEFGPWNSKSLESRDFLRGLGAEDNGEADAEATLRILNVFLDSYRTTYPEVGLPQSLEALSGPAGGKASAEHAMVLDPSFMASPLVKDGYQFQYTLVDPGTGKEHKGRYRITATPVEFSKNSGRSFFTDETHMIRATTDQREANENDQPLGEGRSDDDQP